MDAISIKLTRCDVGKINVPRPAGSFAQANALFVLSRCIEQAQFDGLGGFGEQRKINPAAIPGCPSREGRSGGLMRWVVLRGRADHLGINGERRSPTARGLPMARGLPRVA